MWLLEHDGTLHEGDAPSTEVPGEALSNGEALPASEAPLAIRFAATQDGRGFSLARRLRLHGHEARLVAVGPLEPDQARHAFQSGFDAVAIENDMLLRHGREAWANALNASVTMLYLSDPTARLAGADPTGIWSRRHSGA